MGCFGQAPREAGAIRVKIGGDAVKINYLNAAREAAERAERSAAQAAEAASHSPKTGENGNWQIWDAESGAYADSGVPCRGERGETGPRGEQGLRGETGPRGETGQPGEITQAQLQQALSVFGSAAGLDYEVIMEYTTEGLHFSDEESFGDGG